METTHRVWLFTMLALSLLVLGPPRARAVVQVGNGSCVTGFDVCLGNSGDIGTKSCNGEEACEGNSGAVLNDSCNEDSACAGNSGAVGERKALTKREFSKGKNRLDYL